MTSDRRQKRQELTEEGTCHFHFSYGFKPPKQKQIYPRLFHRMHERGEERRSLPVGSLQRPVCAWTLAQEQISGNACGDNDLNTGKRSCSISLHFYALNIAHLDEGEALGVQACDLRWLRMREELKSPLPNVLCPSHLKASGTDYAGLIQCGRETGVGLRSKCGVVCLEGPKVGEFLGHCFVISL
jgi:hypothetical protein